MMKLYSVLILLVTLSAAYGLKCFVCLNSDPKSCTDSITCPPQLDRCSSLELQGLVTKSCLLRDACIGPIKCCDTDLCNSAMTTGSSVFLLLVSSVITAVFL